MLCRRPRWSDKEEADPGRTRRRGRAVKCRHCIQIAYVYPLYRHIILYVYKFSIGWIKLLYRKIVWVRGIDENMNHIKLTSAYKIILGIYIYLFGEVWLLYYVSTYVVDHLNVFLSVFGIICKNIRYHFYHRLSRLNIYFYLFFFKFRHN